jgi:hypothetical protein
MITANVLFGKGFERDCMFLRNIFQALADSLDVGFLVLEDEIGFVDGHDGDCRLAMLGYNGRLTRGDDHANDLICIVFKRDGVYKYHSYIPGYILTPRSAFVIILFCRY